MSIIFGYRKEVPKNKQVSLVLNKSNRPHLLICRSNKYINNLFYIVPGANLKDFEPGIHQVIVHQGIIQATSLAILQFYCDQFTLLHYHTPCLLLHQTLFSEKIEFKNNNLSLLSEMLEAYIHDCGIIFAHKNDSISYTNT